MHERFPQHFFMGMVVIALGLVVTGWIGFAAVKAAKRANDVITVTGSARQSVRSDMAQWDGSLYVNAHSLQEGYAQLQQRMNRVREFLKAHRVPDSLIVVSTMQSREMSERRPREGMKSRERDDYENVFIGYQLTQRFELKWSQVDTVDALARDISALVGEGIPVQSSPPRFYFTRLADMRTDLLAAATRDARGRAEAIAGSGGGKVGAMRTARMGVFQVTQPLSRDVSDYGIYDTSTIEKEITAVVNVTFAVE